MKKIKKTLIITICFLMMALLIPSSNALAAKKQESVATSVKKFMSYLKSSNEKKLKSYGLSYDEIKKTNKPLYSYIKKCNKKISYKILNTKKSGSKATVKLQIKYIDSSEVANNAYNQILVDILFGTKDFDNMSEKQLLKYYSSLIQSSTIGVKTKYRTQTVNVNLVKKDKKWKLGKISKTFENVLLADIPRAFQKVTGEF